MKLKPETVRIQHNFATYCRSGISKSIPGTRQNRIHHYRRLVFNVVKSTMKQAFPITHHLLGTKEWDELIHNFFEEHDCQAPQIWKLPYELLEYAEEISLAEKLNRPYLNDLLLFEWTEIEVHTMPDEEKPEFCPTGQMLEDPLVMNPEYRLIRLDYPVHIYSASEVTAKKGNYFVLVFRDLESGKVNFMNLSVLHAYLFEKAAIDEKNLLESIEEAAEIFHINNWKQLLKNSLKLFHEFKRQKALLGFKNYSCS
ncbi:MAG: putative DNA-binding domain-containing protein [Bacteroidales bacterium]|nr:putative DNA-binding domain-containing protein [Bacteroidales bacterium]